MSGLVGLLLGAHLAVAASLDVGKISRRVQYAPEADQQLALSTAAVKTLLRAQVDGAKADLINYGQLTTETPQAMQNALDEQLRGVKDLDPDEAKKLRDENRRWQQGMMDAAIERSLQFHTTAPNGLSSRWLWFWTNHFNVYGPKDRVRIFLAHYESRAIAAHAFGSFRNLLRAVVLHPAMLVYLDNQNNQRDRINENLAREILELHTLGEGQGYTQSDIKALARALTGYTLPQPGRPRKAGPCRRQHCVQISDSGSVFEPDLHDMEAKVFLGHYYPARSDGAELFDMLDALAAHPATARHIATQLAQYFYGDEPPADLVEAAQATFLRTGGALDEVLLRLLQHPRFLDARQRWVSDPFAHWVGIVRQLREAGVELPVEQLTKWLKWNGEGHFNRVSPDGYPFISTFWDGATTLSTRLNIAESVASTVQQQLKQADGGLAGQMPRLVARLKPNLGPNSAQVLEPYEKTPVRWLTLYFVSPEMLYH
ncbi:MAG TPA: DUF1800 domain-containing protein [Limnobacter sp.]|uniref:DUF1800 domain-containing protein n=1 Tax=Limnobacter sp. TaxID=2003368 RepID=UPI002ED8D138